MVNKEEIRKVIEAIDVFKLLSIKGESERAEYGRISLIWGLFSFFIFLYFGLECVFWVLWVGLSHFCCGIFPYFTYFNFSSIFSLLGHLRTNNLHYFESFLLFKFIYVLFISLLIFGFIFLYRLSAKRKINKNSVPIKYSLSGQIGIAWMLIFLR